jgi:hypothetical protein
MKSRGSHTLLCVLSRDLTKFYLQRSQKQIELLLVQIKFCWFLCAILCRQFNLYKLGELEGGFCRKSSAAWDCPFTFSPRVMNAQISFKQIDKTSVCSKRLVQFE